MWPIDQLYIELGFYLFASGPVVKAKFFSSKLLFSWTSFLPGGFLWAFSGQLGTNLGSLQVPKKRPERLKEDGKKLIHEKIYFLENNWLHTPARTLSISGLKSRVFKLWFLSLKMMVKSGLEFILKLTEPLLSCCCPVQKCLPRMAELAWQLSRYLWRGSVNFKINSRPLFTIISKLKNDNFKTRDFSPLIERVLTGVMKVKFHFDLLLLKLWQN